MSLHNLCVFVPSCGHTCSLSSLFRLPQNFFGDPWNVLDFIIVVGSLVDIAASRLAVSGNDR